MAPETGAASAVASDAFMRARDAMASIQPRPEIVLEDAPPPNKLAPYAHAIGGTVTRSGEEVATGRLILLHDPAGHPAWEGTIRLVTYVTAELEPEIAGDPMLAGVAWSWLVDALVAHDAPYRAIGGTVTLTASTRFGDLSGPPGVADLEIRASWTPEDDTVAAHTAAWCALLASTAGLPPPGVASLAARAAQHVGPGGAR